MLPGPTEIPNFRIFHLETPSPYTEFGIKGMGEGGAIAPPAVIFNAVNDALQASRRGGLADAADAAQGAGGHREGQSGTTEASGGVAMKAAQFDYVAPRDTTAAVAALADGAGEAKLVGGGQSLGPMLNLRLARPKLLVDVSAHRRAAPRRGSRRHGLDRRGRDPRRDRGRHRRAVRRTACCDRSRRTSPTARCAIAAPSAAALRMPIRPPTGRSPSPRSTACCISADRRAGARCAPTPTWSRAYTTELAEDEMIEACRGAEALRGRPLGLLQVLSQDRRVPRRFGRGA